MTLKTVLLATLAGALLTTAAHAQVELTITGSTAFRSITKDRVASLFDASGRTTNTLSTDVVTYGGTVAGKIPALGSTPVILRLSFSGSASGMLAVKNGTPINTIDAAGSSTAAKVPDLALSDVFPGSATPAIAESAFARRDIVGVVPFVFVRNNALTGVNNITRDQAVLLMTASGDFGMPATYLGGSSPNPVYLIGRDSGSGTRICIQKCIGLGSATTPTLWATNAAGNYVTTNGYSSGGTVAGVVGARANAIGYMGLGDFTTISNKATTLSYNGVAYSSASVTSGKYSLWGYEHLVSRIGLSSNQGALRDRLVTDITNPTYQGTDPNYVGKFEVQNDMEVERGADGGVITSFNF